MTFATIDYDVIENGADTEEQYYKALQEAINGGIAWSFQGSYGRTLVEAIKSGWCLLGHNRARDYYGNTIPSRDDVVAGTPGSYEYVVEVAGQEWADFVSAI